MLIIYQRTHSRIYRDKIFSYQIVFMRQLKEEKPFSQYCLSKTFPSEERKNFLYVHHFVLQVFFQTLLAEHYHSEEKNIIGCNGPTSGGVVTLKISRREVPGSDPGRACRPIVVFSETRVNTGQDPLERPPWRARHLQERVPLADNWP